MLFNMLSVILWILFFILLGNATLRVFKMDSENPFLSIWIGMLLASVTAATSVLFFPLSKIYCLCFLVLFSLFGIISAYSSFKKAFSNFSRLYITFFLLSMLFVFFVIVICTTSTGAHYDTNLYHANVVRWLREYGLVPGLGNLHGRLVTPSGWLNLAALLEQGPWLYKSAFFMPSILLLATILYFSYMALSARCAGLYIYSLCMIFFIALGLTAAGARSEFFIPGGTLYYDQPALLVYIVAVAEIIRYCTSYNMKVEPKRLCVIAALLGLSFFFKPLDAPTILVFLFTLAIYILNKRLTIIQTLKIVSPMVLLFFVWCVQNAVLSGWILYPISIIPPLPFDWVVDKSTLIGIKNAVMGWARSPDGNYIKSLQEGISFWIGPWLARHLPYQSLWAIAFLPFLAGCLLWIISFCSRRMLKLKIIFFILSIAQLSYWFYQHPSLRFGVEFFWTWFALGLIMGLPKKFEHVSTSRPLFIVALLFLICCSIWRLDNISFSNIVSNNLLLYQRELEPSEGLKKEILNPNSPDEFMIYVPKEGDDRCGNSPLPCMPYPPGRQFLYIQDHLYMRSPGDLAKGFKSHK